MLACILSSQVHGADAFSLLQELFHEISDSSSKANHGRDGGDGSSKDSYEGSGQWRGFFFDDVSLWLG